LTLAKSGAANDELVGAPFGDFHGAGDGANAAADAHFEVIFFAGLEAELLGEGVVVAGADSGVEVDDVEPLVGLEFFEEAEDVGDGEFALAAVDELDGLAGLEVDARDQHGRRTSICWVERNFLSWRMDWVLS
jgi:hypothetical protein